MVVLDECRHGCAVRDAVRLQPLRDHLAEYHRRCVGVTGRARGHERRVAQRQVGRQAEVRRRGEHGERLGMPPTFARVAEELCEARQAEREPRSGIGERLGNGRDGGGRAVERPGEAAHHTSSETVYLASQGYSAGRMQLVSTSLGQAWAGLHTASTSEHWSTLQCIGQSVLSQCMCASHSVKVKGLSLGKISFVVYCIIWSAVWHFSMVFQTLRKGVEWVLEGSGRCTGRQKR